MATMRVAPHRRSIFASSPCVWVAILAVAVLVLLPAAGVRGQDLGVASKRISQGQYAQALGEVDGVLADRPRHPEALFLRSVALSGQGKVAEARAVLQRLTEEFPELPEPHNNLAVLYAQQGRYDQARERLEMAIQIKPDYAVAHENLGDVYAQMAIDKYRIAGKLDPRNAALDRKLKLTREIFASSARPQ